MRAVRCAVAIRDGVRALGVEIRSGLHTGEVELADTGVEGIAVHIGARACSRNPARYSRRARSRTSSSAPGSSSPNGAATS